MNDAQLSRSPLVLSFLELSEAVRVIPHAVASPARPLQDSSSAQSTPPGSAAKQERAPEESHIIAQQSQSLTAGSKGQMRLGFKIEQRVHLKRHIQVLRNHLDRALTELRAAG